MSNHHRQREAASSSPPPVIVNVQGRSLLVPQTDFSRAVVMGNTASSSSATASASVSASASPLASSTTTTPPARNSNRTSHNTAPAVAPPHGNDGRPLSNLSVLMQQQQQEVHSSNQKCLNSKAAAATQPEPTAMHRQPKVDEADSASGPVQQQQQQQQYHQYGYSCNNLGSSDPVHRRIRKMSATGGTTPTSSGTTASSPFGWIQPAPKNLSRQYSTGTIPYRARRCLSSKELVTLAPPSGSPYAAMLHQKEEIESKMRQRMTELTAARDEHLKRNNNNNTNNSTNSSTPLVQQEPSDESTTSSTNTRKREGANELRNRRRTQHYHAVVNDLCEVVADLFLAESKLIKPVQYGFPNDEDGADDNSRVLSPNRRNQVVEAVQNFVAALPTRYALGADTASEVLLHMRLMAAARSEKTKAVIHIHSLQDDSHWNRKVASLTAEQQKSLRLVTICCSDGDGLLEIITKSLSSCGSRVLDADVMLSSDGIALDRFVVEMTGRLRLDKLANRIESFLKHAQAEKERSTSSSKDSCELSGSIYFTEARSPKSMTTKDIQEDLKSAVPLLDVLEQQNNPQALTSGYPPQFPTLRKINSMPLQLESRYQPLDRVTQPIPMPVVELKPSEVAGGGSLPPSPLEEEPPTQKIIVEHEPTPKTSNHMLSSSNRQRRPLVNRSATYDLDGAGYSPNRPVEPEQPTMDYLTVPIDDGDLLENRRVPLIPFEELMLIETIGTGRVSTIYRAVWQRRPTVMEGEISNVRMVALKVAMVNGATGDTSHVDEVRREADIAARLSHPNICTLAGVAADSECFCLAYDYCEGGSLHSLLSDSSRYYEYLPIALDVANGMAYLHSRNIIHRDLKPSNILLTRDHRSKICDFGMSVMNQGQELTAETGTYRYMAPEVIRHESYSSNADVYSFGICLWQLITREVPFATMTPIQAAYAVAQGQRPTIPTSTPRRLQEIIMACWDQDSYRRPSFTYVAMALADYAKMAFSPANVGALTLQIANEMLASVDGNSTVNVDFSTPVSSTPPMSSYLMNGLRRSESDSMNSDIGLQI